MHYKQLETIIIKHYKQKTLGQACEGVSTTDSTHKQGTHQTIGKADLWGRCARANEAHCQ
jgi:hypothetical protein